MFLCLGMDWKLLHFPLLPVCYQTIHLFCDSKAVLSSESSRSCEVGLTEFLIVSKVLKTVVWRWWNFYLSNAALELEGKNCQGEAWIFGRKTSLLPLKLELGKAEWHHVSAVLRKEFVQQQCSSKIPPCFLPPNPVSPSKLIENI